MPETASGIMSGPLDALADLIAGTSAFQTWTGKATAAAAKTRIYPHAQEGDDVQRPCAIIEFQQSVTGRGGYEYGEFKVQFQNAVSAKYLPDGDQATDYWSACLEHTNNVGAVKKEACEDSEASGALHLDHREMFRLSWGPYRCRDSRREDGVDYYASIFTVRFGIPPR